MNGYDKWAYLFREAKNLNVVPPALAADPFHDALEVARTANFSADDWEAYERAKMAEQDARGALSVAREEGRDEGLAEGHKAGVAEGIVEGKRDALLRALARRGITPTGAEQIQIDACVDLATLDRWFDNALVATTMTEVLS